MVKWLPFQMKSPIVVAVGVVIGVAVTNPDTAFAIVEYLLKYRHLLTELNIIIKLQTQILRCYKSRSVGY